MALAAKNKERVKTFEKERPNHPSTTIPLARRTTSPRANSNPVVPCGFREKTKATTTTITKLMGRMPTPRKHQSTNEW